MQKMTGVELGKAMANFVNNFSHDSKAFTDTILCEHKTLQQSVIRLTFNLIRAMAQQNWVDARNEQAVQVCKHIVEKCGDEMRLPLI